MPMPRPALALLSLALLLPCSPLQGQQASEPAEEIQISRVAGEIEVDGSLGDPGWSTATRVETFYETNPGDNVEPKVKTVAWITYDERYFYAAFEFSDPDAKSIRAPLGDRDVVPSYTDYGGVILDTRNDGKTGFMFLVNPRNIQYDAISSDVSGEDSAPDFFWDSATRIGPEGWTLEIRVPLSSLRYDARDVQTWGILLYRNYPRDFRYQMFSSKLPRGSNCFICFEKKITGLTGLPTSNHLVLAPYGAGRLRSLPEDGRIGSRLDEEPADWDVGLDAKWNPNAETALDLTLNPDFSQVESDVAQITANERFALFLPEKRPFFLERADILAAPIATIYTRTLTSPRWGARATGEIGDDTVYTALVADDRGGGLVILPGPISSSFALQDYSSTVALGRVRKDFGKSFATFLFTDREIDGNDGGGYNRTAGVSGSWRPNNKDAINGQLMWSDTETPVRPDLTPQWDGRKLSAHAAFASWVRNTRTYDWTFEYRDSGDDFRADVGFVPQVGVRDEVLVTGYSFFPKQGLFRRIRPYLRNRYVLDTDNDLVLRRWASGIFLDGIWSSSTNAEVRRETLRVGTKLIESDYLILTSSLSPSGVIGGIALNVTIGETPDVVNARPGWGATVGVETTVRPTDHLALQFIGSRRTLDVSPTGTGARDERLLTSDVARLKATYTFTSRAFLRLIGQRTSTDSSTALYAPGVVRAHQDTFNGSALFAYKLNWQTVLFVGYEDNRGLPLDSDRLRPSGRELFFKISYAFQR
ncbi:MAG TPA: DUF5916 domain-containing protein [Thermoanaerobaculia bacterium]|nr:DUF5916 domain-containing protein [Thermoanaerobaculia bacterium]